MANRNLSGETVELYWPRDTRFRDVYADLEFHGEGTYNVPVEHEAHYRNRGWEDPPEDSGDAEDPSQATSPNLDTPPRDQIEGQPVEDDGDEAESDESDGDGDEGADSDSPNESPAEDESDAGDFDAEAFVRDGDADDVAEAIADGEVDDHLQAVREAEEAYRDRVTVNDALDARGDA